MCLVGRMWKSEEIENSFVWLITKMRGKKINLVYIYNYVLLNKIKGNKFFKFGSLFIFKFVMFNFNHKIDPFFNRDDLFPRIYGRTDLSMMIAFFMVFPH